MVVKLLLKNFRFNQYDRYEGFGGNPPTFTGVYPDLYCSGFQASDCSKDWYPDDLVDYDFLTYYGSLHMKMRVEVTGI